MTLLHSSETPKERVTRLMAEAMQRDMDGQRKLIDARTRGETKAVYWQEQQDAIRLAADRHRRNQLQCALVRIHLASEGVRKEIERARALLLGLDQLARRRSPR